MIGIIGQGFVRNAVYQKFKNYYNIITYDLQVKLCNGTIEEIMDKCKIIFVCLPTPMSKDGKCFTGIVEEELKDLELLASMTPEIKTVAIQLPINNIDWPKSGCSINKIITALNNMKLKIYLI